MIEFFLELAPPLTHGRRWIEEAFAADTTLSWDEAAQEKFRSILREKGTEVDAAILAAIKQQMADPKK